ncbi:MAG: reverse transcriptase domain-containing protein [Mycobacterium sp.]
MSAVEERISDRRLLSLLRAFLRAGVMKQGTVRRPVTGTAQGGVISPLMCNVYLHRLDRAWPGEYGTYVRYADDALVMCRSKGQAVAALAPLTVLLAELGLRPRPAKTRIVQLSVGGPGSGLPGLPPPAGAIPGRPRPRGGHLPGPLALTQDDAACPRVVSGS